MTVLHIKEYGGWNIGPDIRKCTECGTRLWIAADGTWTDSRKVWESPPAGFVNCKSPEAERQKAERCAGQ